MVLSALVPLSHQDKPCAGPQRSVAARQRHSRDSLAWQTTMGSQGPHTMKECVCVQGSYNAQPVGLFVTSDSGSLPHTVADWGGCLACSLQFANFGICGNLLHIFGVNRKQNEMRGCGMGTDFFTIVWDIGEDSTVKVSVTLRMLNYEHFATAPSQTHGPPVHC